MKNKTELPGSITPESIMNQVSVIDIPEFRENLRQLMDWGFLYSKQVGTDLEPAWCAVQAVETIN